MKTTVHNLEQRIAWLCLVGSMALTGCNRTPSESKEPPAAPESPAVSLSGVWKGRFVEQLPVRGASSTYPAEYEIALTVGNDNKIDSISWVDLNNWMGRFSFTWDQPDRASAVCEERESGKPELVFSPLYPVFKVVRQGQALSLDYARAGQGKISLNSPRVFPQASLAPADNTLARQPDGSFKARINVVVLPRGLVTVPVSDIKDFAGSALWLTRFGELKAKQAGSSISVETSGDMLDKVNCKAIALFSGGSGGLSCQMNLQNVKAKRKPDVNLGVQPDIIVLKPDSKVELEATMQYARTIEVVFFKDGRAKAKVPDRRIAGTEKPFEFDLTRSDGK